LQIEGPAHGRQGSVSHGASPLIAMRPLGARMKLAQRRQFFGARRLRRRDVGGVFDPPAGIAVDLVARHTRVNRHHRHFLGDRIRLEHAQVRNQPGRALGLDPKAGPVVAAFALAERGDEVELLHETAPAVGHDDEDFAAGDYILIQAPSLLPAPIGRSQILAAGFELRQR
jgi:hypothetical protein